MEHGDILPLSSEPAGLTTADSGPGVRIELPLSSEPAGLTTAGGSEIQCYFALSTWRQIIAGGGGMVALLFRLIVPVCNC
jgi:hypothetical protein